MFRSVKKFRWLIVGSLLFALIGVGVYFYCQQNIANKEIFENPKIEFILYTAEYSGKNAFLFSHNLIRETPDKIADLGSDFTFEIAISPDSK